MTRIALSLLPEYTDQIEQFLTEQTGKAVTIGSFSSRWEVLDPVLDVRGLTVNGDEQFYVNNIRFQFAFWSSVLALSPKFERVLIDEAEMVIRQQEDGRWFFVFSEFDFKSEKDSLVKESTPADISQDALLKYLVLFNGTTLNLKNINATIYRQNGSKRNLRLPNLNVNYKDDQIYASGQVLESQGDKALLNFSLHGRGLLKGSEVKGTVYVEARSSEFFSELLSIYDWQKVSIQNVEASSRAWLNFEATKIVSVYGDIQVSEMNWKIAEKSLPPLNDLAFSYFWQSAETVSRLSLYDLGFDWANLSCDHGDVKVSLEDEKLSIQAEKMKLQCISRLLLSLDLPSEKLNARLFQSNPKGYLKNIHFSMQSSQSEETLESHEDPLLAESLLPKDSSHEGGAETVEGTQVSPRFSFEALLDHVNINAYDGAPSAKNLSGYIFADNVSGYVSFLSENFELGFPELFLDPWPIQRAEGLVHWALQGDDVAVYSEGLRLWRDHESLIYGDFILRLNPDDREDYLGLSLGMQDIAFTDAVKFVPFYEVDHDLYNWLKDSLVSGNVSRGVYYGYGSIESNAPKNSFTSSIQLAAVDGELKFDPAWPPLEQLGASVILQNGQLDIAADDAMIANTQLLDITAFMPQVKPGRSNAIKINAQAKVTNDRVHYWLAESPIADATRHVAEQLLIDASPEVQIKLSVPVAQAKKVEERIDISYQIAVMLNNAAIDHVDSRLSFSDVKGTLKIDSGSGLEAKDIKLKLFNKPAQFSLKSEFRNAEKEGDQYQQELYTRLFLNGNARVEAIFNYLGLNKSPVLAGEIDYSASLSFSDRERQYPMLTIASDLKNVACDCPHPFRKNPGMPASMNLSLLLKPDQSYLEGRINAPDMPGIKTELLLVGGTPSFGEVLIGGAKVKNTQIKGLNIAAQLKKADLATWIDFIKKVTESKLMLAASDEENNSNLDEAARSNGFLKQVQLEVSELNAYDYLMRDSKIRLYPDNTDQWQVQLSGNDIVGRISLSTDSKPLSFELSKLNLVAVDTAQQYKPSSSKAKESEELKDPRQLPEVKFKTSSLLLDGRPLGAWQFDMKPDSTGVVIRNLKGHYNGTNISGQLNWRYEQDTQRTIATLMVEGRDVETVFDMFGFPPLISSERFVTDVALVWPAAPFEFAMKNLSGKVSVDLESGFIRTEDEKTGALRLFGVLNAESIKRRLKLDFSDLYKSGIGYDSFTGVATIDNGLLSLTESLSIEGPAGKYVVNGRSDLATKALDFDMLVELPFSQNFPLAALVLGAPQVGGLVWVADKLLGEPLSALTTSRYDITGTWEQPRVDLHQAVNASKKDRSQEKGMRDSRQ